MTPKEKATDLYNKFRNENSVMSANFRAKKQATICVNEILQYGCFSTQPQIEKANKIKPKSIYKEYWQEVIKEIKDLW